MKVTFIILVLLFPVSYLPVFCLSLGCIFFATWSGGDEDVGDCVIQAHSARTFDEVCRLQQERVDTEHFSAHSLGKL